MQSVDVLGHQHVQSLHRFQRRECDVRGVGPRPRNDRPPDHAARPVALSRRLGAQEILQHHRRAALPAAVLVAVARDARIGTNPCAGQDEQPPIPSREVMKVNHGRFSIQSREARSSMLAIMRMAIGVQKRAESALIRPLLSRTADGHLRLWELAFLLSIRCSAYLCHVRAPPKFWPVTSLHSENGARNGVLAPPRLIADCRHWRPISDLHGSPRE